MLISPSSRTDGDLGPRARGPIEIPDDALRYLLLFEAMLRLSDSHGTAFIIVTHDAAIAARACARS